MCYPTPGPTCLANATLSGSVLALATGLFVLVNAFRQGMLIDEDGNVDQAVPATIGLILFPLIYLIDTLVQPLPSILTIFPRLYAIFMAPLALMVGLIATSFLAVGIGAITAAITHLLIENYV